MAETVSVVMANYNKEKYIGEAIESILNQQHKEIELIIIDDGSTDSSPAIIKEYAKFDSRITYQLFAHQGKIKVFNEGVKKAGGKYLTIRSSDDFIFEHAFNVLVKAIKGYDLVAHNLTITDEKLKVIRPKFVRMSRYTDPIRLEDIINGLSFPSGSYLFNKKAVDLIFPLPDKVPFEDWYIFMTLIYNKLRIKFFDEDLAFYRQLKGSAYGGVYNYDRELIKYRAKRELEMIDIFSDVLPEKYLNDLNAARQDLTLIAEGKLVQAFLKSGLTLKRRPARLIIKKVLFPFLRFI